LKGLKITMSENEYNLANILDKKDFSVHLQEEPFIDEPFFTEDTTIITSHLGYDIDDLFLTEESTRNLVSENFKGIIHVPDSYFHYFSDFVGPIKLFLQECIERNIQKVEIISVILEPKHDVVEKFDVFLEHCFSKFNDRIEIINTTINENQRLSDFNKAYIEINKFRIIDQRDIGISIEGLYEDAKSFSECLEESVPNKKVFISRRNDLVADLRTNRTLYEEDVEALFKSIGFEVISAKSFETLKEQIKYFDNVAVFAGYTGAGLTSSMFMKPGQTVVEVVCPLVFYPGSEYDANGPIENSHMQYEIHNFYKTISMLKKHAYLTVSNINNSKEDLLKQLNTIAKAL
jgi:hypothetical protein